MISDSCRNRVAADCTRYHGFGIVDGEPVAGQFVAFEVEVEKVAAAGALGKYTAGPWYIFERCLKLAADLFDFVEVRSEHLDAEGRADAGGEHVGAGLDGHGPGV